MRRREKKVMGEYFGKGKGKLGLRGEREEISCLHVGQLPISTIVCGVNSRRIMAKQKLYGNKWQVTLHAIKEEVHKLMAWHKKKWKSKFCCLRVMFRKKKGLYV